jgi:hypothetical protein
MLSLPIVASTSASDRSSPSVTGSLSRWVTSRSYVPRQFSSSVCCSTTVAVDWRADAATAVDARRASAMRRDLLRHNRPAPLGILMAT